MPLLAGWTPVTVDLAPNGSGCQGVTGEMAQQHGYPSARRRRQLCPRHGHCRECRPHAVSRSIGPMRLARPGRFAVLQSPKIALQTQSGDRIENLIKRHKSQLASDRTSCRSPLANQMRLTLHTAAYWLMRTLRDAIPRPQALASGEFSTIRLRLLKIAVRVRETATRIRLAFAANCPDAALFRGLVRRLILRPT